MLRDVYAEINLAAIRRDKIFSRALSIKKVFAPLSR